MSIFGEVYSADEALRLSLVDKVVDKGAGMTAAGKLAAVVAGRSATATELAKMLINAAEGEEQERVLDAFAGRIAAASEDLRRGLAAFREKSRRSGD
jgi:enoyl-CoA hydratase/carnithine racemase